MKKDNIGIITAIAIVGALAFFLYKRKQSSGTKDLQTISDEYNEQLLKLDAKRKMPKVTKDEVSKINSEIKRIQGEMANLGLRDALSTQSAIEKVGKGLMKFSNRGV